MREEALVADARMKDVAPSTAFRVWFQSSGRALYRDAFHHAYHYGHADEATADRIAWSAVKRAYDKADGGPRWSKEQS